MAEIKRRKTRMYEPWGYRDQNDYQGVGDVIASEMNVMFSGVKYNAEDKKIHFYNNDGEELSGNSIDVTQFAQSVVERTWYDEDTKTLHILFSNGDETVIDMTALADRNDFLDGLMTEEDPSDSGNTLVKVKIADDSKDYLSVSMSGVSINSGITELEEKAFTHAELDWNDDESGFNINYYNIKNNQKETITLFETDENGNVPIGPGANGPGF